LSYKTARQELHEEFMMKTTLIKKKAGLFKRPWKITFVESPRISGIFSVNNMLQWLGCFALSICGDPDFLLFSPT
jgi:hypothetical protein